MIDQGSDRDWAYNGATHEEVLPGRTKGQGVPSETKGGRRATWRALRAAPKLRIGCRRPYRTARGLSFEAPSTLTKIEARLWGFEGGSSRDAVTPA